MLKNILEEENKKKTLVRLWEKRVDARVKHMVVLCENVVLA